MGGDGEESKEEEHLQVDEWPGGKEYWQLHHTRNPVKV